MADGVTLKRDKLDALIAQTAKLDKVACKFGWTGKDGPDTAPMGDSGLTTAQVVQFHEFGLGVPERSPLRGAVADKRKELAQAAIDGATEVLKGAKPEKAVETIGKVGTEAIRDRIQAGLSPPLAESTLEDPDQESTLPLDDIDILDAINFRRDDL